MSPRLPSNNVIDGLPGSLELIGYNALHHAFVVQPPHLKDVLLPKQLAVLLSSAKSSLPGCIGKVIGLSPEPEMVGVNTGSYITGVADHRTLWINSRVEFVGKAMSVDNVRIVPCELAISIGS